MRKSKKAYSKGYYNKGNKTKSTKGKGACGKVQRTFKSFSPSGITQDTLNSSINKLWQHAYMPSTSEVHQRLSAQGLYWSCSQGHTLPSTYQIPDSQESRYSHCLYNLGTMNQSYHLRKVFITAGNCLSFKFSDASQGPILQSQALFNSFLHITLFFLFFLIKVSLTYNLVLASSIKHSGSTATHIIKSSPL